MENTRQPYLFPEAQPSLPLPSTDLPARREPELAARRVAFHLLLLLVTAVTATVTGATFIKAIPDAAWGIQLGAPPDSFWAALAAPVREFVAQTAAGNYGPLTGGLLFAATLLVILGAHELGHYFACRYYGIRATLPFFIPAPPILTPFGTFGAVIKIKEPIRTRRALFDIGIAGPLAGFVFALPASVIGLLMAQPAPPELLDGGGGMQFNDPLLFILVMKWFGLPKWILWNPVYWAAWGALLVTALNLFPVGQLDGGHVLYAVLGSRLHKWVSRAVCVAVMALAVASVWLYSSPVWMIWSVVLLFLLRVGHPPVMEDEPLGRGRIVLAVVAALVFALCFMPFPITFS